MKSHRIFALITLFYPALFFPLYSTVRAHLNQEQAIAFSAVSLIILYIVAFLVYDALNTRLGPQDPDERTNPFI